MTLADAAVIIATLLAWSSLVPQIIRLSRTGDATGVSTTWPAIGLVSNVAWTAYLVSQRLWAAAPSTIVMVLFYVLVFRALHRTGTRIDRAVGRGAVWSIVLAGTALWLGWRALGLVLAWSYVVQLAPAVWDVYRTRTPSGVSAATWALISIEAALWGFYGWWFDDVAILVYAGVGVIGGIAILGRLAAVRVVAPSLT